MTKEMFCFWKPFKHPRSPSRCKGKGDLGPMGTNTRRLANQEVDHAAAPITANGTRKSSRMVPRARASRLRVTGGQDAVIRQQHLAEIDWQDDIFCATRRYRSRGSGPHGYCQKVQGGTFALRPWPAVTRGSSSAEQTMTWPLVYQCVCVCFFLYK
jgi:hypothetical protein